MPKMSLCICLLFCLGHTNVFAAEYTCPESLDVSESTEKIDSSWSVLTDREKIVFSYFALSYGHPDRRAFLKPEPKSEKEELVGKLPVKKWIYDISFREGGEFYLTCYYEDSKLTLTRALGESLRVCEQVDGKLIRSISCY